MTNTFQALQARKDPEHQVDYTTLSMEDLGDGDVTIAVEYSTLNYKDGLAVTNAAPIVQSYPLILGIDLAGTVQASTHNGFAVGDRVVLNGYGASEYLNGGYTQIAKVNGDLLVKLPDNLSTRQAMAIGTAGYTAMLCVLALEDGNVTPASGPVLVTGAAGGVGSVALALLKKLGYDTVASTGRSEETPFLKSLGAGEVIDRTSLSERGKPLQKELWAGVVDCVGSQTLANALAQSRYDGVVAACGLAQGADLPATVMPFILRNVRLQGVDSVQAPMARREMAWARLARDLDLNLLESLSFDVAFTELLALAPSILAGQVRGRAIVDLSR